MGSRLLLSTRYNGIGPWGGTSLPPCGILPAVITPTACHEGHGQWPKCTGSEGVLVVVVVTIPPCLGWDTLVLIVFNLVGVVTRIVVVMTMIGLGREVLMLVI